MDEPQVHDVHVEVLILDPKSGWPMDTPDITNGPQVGAGHPESGTGAGWRSFCAAREPRWRSFWGSADRGKREPIDLWGEVLGIQRSNGRWRDLSATQVGLLPFRCKNYLALQVLG